VRDGYGCGGGDGWREEREGFGGLRNLGWAGRWGGEGNRVGKLWVGLLDGWGCHKPGLVPL